jgi:hypothetical protein
VLVCYSSLAKRGRGLSLLALSTNVRFRGKGNIRVTGLKFR